LEISADFHCSGNQLTSLKFGPEKVGNSFYCSNNKLTSLLGSPKVIKNNFFCTYNNLISLEGCPEKVGDEFSCENNPIHEVYRLFGSYERYKASLDYNYLRGTDIVRGRFRKACIDAGIYMPDSISGYKYIDL
jgi:hypothetical protein